MINNKLVWIFKSFTGVISMFENSKIQIYKGMIQYLLESTDYSLKRIANLTNSSLKSIKLIHSYHQLPPDFNTELQLAKLFQIILELQLKHGCRAKKQFN